MPESREAISTEVICPVVELAWDVRNLQSHAVAMGQRGQEVLNSVLRAAELSEPVGRQNVACLWCRRRYTAWSMSASAQASAAARQVRHGGSESGAVTEYSRVLRSHARHSRLSFWRVVVLLAGSATLTY